jgi:hypothetical protein
MAKTFNPAVLTANNLAEGHSVFLAAEGWSRRIDAALVALTPEQAEELAALGNRFVAENQIVGPYLVEISLERGAPVPLSRRERIRAQGRPTAGTTASNVARERVAA